MNVLLISDNPENKTFYEVVSLKRAIQECGADVDLLTFSDTRISFNGKKAEKDSGSEILRIVLKRKPYGVVVITLKLGNLRKFLEKGLNDLRNCPKYPCIFVFGAGSALKEIEREGGVNLFLYSRPGVAKLTQGFKNDVLGYISARARF